MSEMQRLGIEWIALKEIMVYTGAILYHMEVILNNLSVNTSRMYTNLNITRGLIQSEAVMMNLAKKLGWQQAHSLLYRAAMRAFEEGRLFKEILVETSPIRDQLGEKELEELLKPENYVGESENVVEMTAKKIMNREKERSRSTCDS